MIVAGIVWLCSLAWFGWLISTAQHGEETADGYREIK
jgi:hypothetical protein